MQNLVLSIGAMLTAMVNPTQSQSAAANKSMVLQWAQKGDDSIGQGFRRMLQAAEDEVRDSSLTRSGSSNRAKARQHLATLRRFGELKTMVLWLQRLPEFGKYCYYGCYCMPFIHRFEEPDNLPKAKGTPVDAADSACKVQGDCYWCAAQDSNNRENCNPDVKYNYRLMYDESDPQNIDLRGIVCEDQWVSEGGNLKTNCRRSICECDRGLAYRLRAAQDTWNEIFHKKRGEFDDAVCHSTGPGPKVEKDSCCGSYTDDGRRFPFATLDGFRGCCGSKTYDSQIFECCDAEQSLVRSVGNCL